MNKKTVLLYFGFAAACLFLFLFQTGTIPLWSSDEGRFGEIAREMWELKEWVVPRFNYIDYLEKPVLSPLVTALLFGLLGVSSFTARLPSILSALAGILVTYFAARRLFDVRAARYAALVLATSVGYVLVGRFAVIDMQMILLMSTAVFLLMSGYFRQCRRDYLLAYVLMGLAFLTKGLIGICLPALIFFVFLTWTRRWDEIPKLSLGWGLLIVALITLPWGIAISLKEPEFFRIFILEHHFQRFATGGFGRVKPFWFFTYVAPVVSFPWTLFIPAAMAHGLEAPSPPRDKIKFLICWIAVIFIFFSIPKPKLAYYIVPMTVPVSVLIGAYLSAWTAGQLSAAGMRIMNYVWKGMLFVCLGGALGLTIAAFAANDEKVQILRAVILACAALLALGGILSYEFFRRSRFRTAVISLAGMIYIVLLTVFMGMIRLSPSQSTYAFAAELKSILRPDDRVAIFGSPDHFSDFPFHLQRRLLVVGSDRGTLDQESREKAHQAESNFWFLMPEQFARFFNAKNQRVFCLLDDDRLAALQEQGLGKFSRVKHGDGKLLISNQ